MVNDIVSDILARVVEASRQVGRFDEALALKIEMQVRADWGGGRANIALNAEQKRFERNRRIRASWEAVNYDHRMLKVLAQRFDLSEKQLKRVLRKTQSNGHPVPMIFTDKEQAK